MRVWSHGSMGAMAWLGKRSRLGSLTQAMAMATAVSLALANTARAGFSSIYSPPLPGNSTQTSLLDNIYGGAFTLEGDGVSYTNGTISALRVSDYLPSNSATDNPGTNGTDQLWEATSVQASVKYSFAELPSAPFGYMEGASGGSFTPLFGITGSGYAVSGSGSFAPAPGVFRFGAENTLGLISSSPSDNQDGEDHMVTYQIDGLDGSGDTWLVLFNDFGTNVTNTYFDYQNLVIQVNTVGATALSSSSVPEPGSLMLLGGIGLGLLKRLPRRVR
jgi:hypothetical protein